VAAARIARTFKIDPIVVLDAEPFEWLARIAAHNVVVLDAEKANKEARKRR
jgi:hypothetical protein